MRSLNVVKSSVIGLLLVSALALAGCSKATPTTDGAFANDLKGAPPGRPGAAVGKGGIADDGIKPMPVAPVAKGGIADDGIKPMPVAPIAKGGVADDGVKPLPLAAPVPLAKPAPH